MKEDHAYTNEYEILSIVKTRLYQQLHGLAPVLGAVCMQVGEYGGAYRTDGTALFLDADRLRRTFLEDSDRLCLEILHMLGHCLLGHPFRARSLQAQDPQHWAEACDREAWELAREIWDGVSKSFGERSREKATEKAGEKAVEKAEGKAEGKAIGQAGERAASRIGERSGETAGFGTHDMFEGIVDDSSEWLQTEQQRSLARASGDQGKGSGDEGESDSESLQLTLSWWQRQQSSLRQELQNRKRRPAGTALRSHTRRLVPAAGQRGDYRSILRGLSSYREDARVSPDEFQYAWYAYGLELYDDVPLIEPLEYTEDRKIADLVIVIDTSGSCERELVQVFLEETRGILEQDRLFFRRFCLHILQCDNRIQRDDRITNQEEFEAYLQDLTISGGGGTDFRPAFARIAELREKGELGDLQGILYFTDGIGRYPRAEPDYQVIFVMLEGTYDTIDMPPWIQRFVLKRD